jgi:hypothetical protein
VGRHQFEHPDWLHSSGFAIVDANKVRSDPGCAYNKLKDQTIFDRMVAIFCEHDPTGELTPETFTEEWLPWTTNGQSIYLGRATISQRWALLH